MRSLTPTALSILAQPGEDNGSIITKCAIDPETHDVYATIEDVGDDVGVSLVKYQIGQDGHGHAEVCLE
jgi:hypothetical protein